MSLGPIRASFSFQVMINSYQFFLYNISRTDVSNLIWGLEVDLGYRPSCEPDPFWGTRAAAVAAMAAAA